MAWRTDSAEMATVKRYDAGTLGRWEQTPQGGIKALGRPTRAGVLPYRMADGSTRLEYRPAAEVFHPDSLSTLGGAPITDLHPELNGARVPVTPANWKAVSVGTVAHDAHQEGDHVAATFMVQDQAMIQKVMTGGAKELSAGYTCKLDLTPGTTPDGQKYDAVQREIRYNHVAAGPEGWGRAGPTVALRADSGDAEQVPIDAKDQAMKETINGVEYLVGSAEWAAAIRAERDKATGRADAADKALKAAKEAGPDLTLVNALATKRADLLVTCHRAATSKGLVFDDKAAAPASNDDLILQIIMMLDPDADVKGKSPDYLAGVLSTLARTLKDAAGGNVDQLATKDAGTATPPPPAIGGPVAVKTDGKGPSPLFKAREGQEPPAAARQDSPEAKAEAARYDSDLAEVALKAQNAGRGTKPLAITAKR